MHSTYLLKQTPAAIRAEYRAAYAAHFKSPTPASAEALRILAAAFHVVTEARRLGQ